MPLPMFLGGIAKGIAGGTAKGAAKKFVSGKKEKKQEAKTEKKSKIKDIGQKTSKKTKTKSTPKTKKVATVKLPRSVYKDAKEAAKPTADSNVSYDSLSKQLDNINKTAGALGTQAESERQAAKENLRQSRKDAKDKKADDKEKQLEKKKGRKGEGILSVGKKIGKNFGIFDFITNVALGGLALFLLNNFDKIENLFNQLTTNLSNPFKFMQAAIVSMSTVFAGPIRGGLSLLSKPLKFAGRQVAKLAKRIAPMMKKTFASIGSGLVGFAKNTVKRITGSFTGGASGTASGVGTAASRKGQSISKATSKAGRQQGLFNRARKLYGGGARGSTNVAKKGGGRLLKIGGVFKKVPVIGGLLGLFIDLALGEPLDRALVNAIGGGLGAWIGGGAGAILGGGVFSWLTAPLGGIIGYEIGKWAGNKFYDMIKQKMGMIPPIDPKDREIDRASDRIPDRDDRVTGQTYKLPSGEIKVWNGSKFVTPQQYQQQTGKTPLPLSGSTPSTSTSTSQGSNFSGAGRQQQVYNYLKSKGMSHNHAMGLMANIHRESSFRTDPGKGSAGEIGMFQWNPQVGRAQRFEKAVPDWKTNWKGQIDYALREFTGPKYLRMTFGSEKEAADWWMNNWEKPGDPIGASRKQDAYLKNAPITGASQTTQSQQPVTTTGAGTQPVSQTTPMNAQLAPAITRAGQTTQTNVLKKFDLVSGFPVTSPYGPRTHPVTGEKGKLHGGIDISAPTGHYMAYDVPVEVLFTGTDAGYGKLVDVWAPSLGLQFRAAHFSTIECSKGQMLQPGQPIGRVGSTGLSTGSHIHFEVDTVKNRGDYGGALDPVLVTKGAQHIIISPNAPVAGQTPTQARVSQNQQSSGQASSVSSRTSYDPMSQNYGGGVVPVGVPGQSGGGGGAGRSLNMGGPSTQEVLNSYYKSQLMGFLYKQG